MSALADNRNTKCLESGAQRLTRRFTVLAGETIYAGSIVAINSAGTVEAASDSAGLIVVGIALHKALAGEVVDVQTGLFKVAKTGTLTNAANLNNLVFVSDDQTVCPTGSCSNQIKAGVLRYVDTDGDVWVEFGNIRTS